MSGWINVAIVMFPVLVVILEAVLRTMASKEKLAAERFYLGMELSLAAMFSASVFGFNKAKRVFALPLVNKSFQIPANDLNSLILAFGLAVFAFIVVILLLFVHIEFEKRQLTETSAGHRWLGGGCNALGVTLLFMFEQVFAHDTA